MWRLRLLPRPRRDKPQAETRTQQESYCSIEEVVGNPSPGTVRNYRRALPQTIKNWTQVREQYGLLAVLSRPEELRGSPSGHSEDTQGPCAPHVTKGPIGTEASFLGGLRLLGAGSDPCSMLGRPRVGEGKESMGHSHHLLLPRMRQISHWTKMNREGQAGGKIRWGLGIARCGWAGPDSLGR